MKKLLKFLLCLASPFSFSQNLELDAELIEINYHYSSNPKDFTLFQDKLYFNALYVGLEDYSIFNYDGEDFQLMKNNEGERIISSAPIFGESIMYFIGRTRQYEGNNFLWVSDGSENSSIPFLELENGGIEEWITIGDKLFFTYSNVNGKQLWVSNGTAEQTVQLKPLHWTVQDGYFIKNFKEHQGKLFFLTDDPIYGQELWVSDGTTAGTYLVKDIREGVQSSSINSTFIFNNKLYFVANNGTNGYELWTTDGTTNGTYLIKDINSGNYNGLSEYENHFIEFDGNFYFFANNGTNVQLWKSDGTSDGTVLFKNVNTFQWNNSYQTSSISGEATDDYFIFKSYDYTDVNQYTAKLWRSDGTVDGTVEFIELNKNYYPFSNSKFNLIQDKFYFTQESYDQDKELWVTDGTSEGTSSVVGGYRDYSGFKEANGNIFLKAQIDHSENKILKIDFHTNNSSVFLDNVINPERGFGIYNDEIYFGFDYDFHNNYHPNGGELWKSDLNGDNPFLLKDLNTAAPSFPVNYANFYDKTIFFANNGLTSGVYNLSNQNELNFLGEASYDATGYQYNEFYKVGDYYYFIVAGSESNYDLNGLCKTDGTAEGTVKVENGFAYSLSNNFNATYAHIGNQLYFIGSDDGSTGNGNSIWTTNTSINEASKIELNITHTGNLYVNSVFEFNNHIYFSGSVYDYTNHHNNRKGIWKLDVNTNDTEYAFQPVPNGHVADSGTIEILGILNDNLLFYNVKDEGTRETSFYKMNENGVVTELNHFDGSVFNVYQGDLIFHGDSFYLPFTGGVSEKINFVKVNDQQANLVTVQNSSYGYDVNQITTCGNNLYFLEGSNRNLWAMNSQSQFKLIKPSTDMEMLDNLECYNNQLLLFSKSYGLENYPYNYSELMVAKGFQEPNVVNVNVNSDLKDLRIADIFVDNQNKLFLSMGDYNRLPELYISNSKITMNTSDIFVNSATKDSFKIYPNPTSSEINVVSTDQSKIQQIQLYDLTGKLMEIGMYNSNEVKLNLSKYNAGIYLVKVKTEKSTSTQKVIVK